MAGQHCGRLAKHMELWQAGNVADRQSSAYVVAGQHCGRLAKHVARRQNNTSLSEGVDVGGPVPPRQVPTAESEKCILFATLHFNDHQKTLSVC